jgi:type IV secretory pathway TraG/TraD family ATPase VirD4
VLHLLNTFSNNATSQKIDLLFIRANDPRLLSDYKAFVAYDSKMLMSIVATTRTALSIFSDPCVAKVTSVDTLCFEQFQKEKTILYINNSVADMHYYSVISSIFFEQFFGAIMSKLPDKHKDIPVFCLLDESSSLYLNILPTAISNVRKHHCGIFQVYQHYGQIVDLYGSAQARNIAANCYAKIYMSGQSLETAKELEAILGQFEYATELGTGRRPLMSADEIRQSNDAIILCGNAAPIKTKLIPYYEQNSMKKLAALPFKPLQTKLPGDEPSLIPFE